jgi:hypothetical protein
LKNIMVKYHILFLVVMKLIVVQPMCQRWTCYAFVSFSFLFELCILCVMWFYFIFAIYVASKLALYFLHRLVVQACLHLVIDGKHSIPFAIFLEEKYLHLWHNTWGEGLPRTIV